MNLAALQKTAIEGVKYGSGLPRRRAAQQLASLSIEEFWRLQAGLLEQRYLDAKSKVPYYRDASSYPAQLPRTGNVLQSLRHLPILAKATVKAELDGFVRRPRNLFAATHTTGGTTGSPLRIRAGLGERGWTNAILEHRNKLITGERNPRTLRLSGFMGEAGPQVGMRLPGTNIGYLSIYALSPEQSTEVVTFLQGFKPRLLHGYASALTQLARVVDGRVLDLDIAAAVSTSETLSPSDRSLIQQGLGVPVHNEYGSQEGQHLVLECAEEKMHIHPTRGVVEILQFNNDEPAAYGELGRVVVTGLLAREFPLIRYDIGDTAISHDYSSTCACGLSWPAIGTVYGRMEDLVRTRDGRRVGMLSYSTLKDAIGVVDSQIVQRGYETFTYRMRIEEDADTLSLERHVRQQLQARLGYRVEVDFEYYDYPIGRTTSGKRKAVVVDF